MSGIIDQMTASPSSQPTQAYIVDTPVYEGPLDLLLQLIERAELDITKLAIAQVTDQYLQYLGTLSQSDPGEVSAFLVIAAKLIQIKSQLLLPRPPQKEIEQEDVGEALALQLKIYKRFKELAALLGQRENSNLRTYLRLAPPPVIETQVDIEWLSLENLVTIAQEMLAKIDTRTTLGSVMIAPRVTIREKINLIARYLLEFKQGSFNNLFSDKSMRLDIVVTFLAMLELIKLNLIETHQDHIFSDIQIVQTENWNGNTVLELEFGE